MAHESLFARWSHYQLSRLELVFAIIVLLVLASVFLNYMVVMMAKAERSMVERSIVNLNSALRMHTMQAYVDNDAKRIASMQHANPVRLLEQQSNWDISKQLEAEQLAAMVRARSIATLPNYVGELDNAAADELEPGSWYFDTGSNTLVYIIRNAEVFRSELPGRARLRFRLEVYDDRGANHGFTRGRNQVGNVSLRPMDEYQWLI